jgi:mannose-6-phosphate isomerase-like protein (cupin superfamily)
MTDAFAVDDVAVHFLGPGPIDRLVNDPTLWARRDRWELGCGHILTVFRYEASLDYQERHPDGDEFVMVLSGDVELLLMAAGTERHVRLADGLGVIIPAGTWHQLIVHQPSSLLFVTPVPARTQHRSPRDVPRA